MNRRSFIYCCVFLVLFLLIPSYLYAADTRIHFKGQADVAKKRIYGEIVFSEDMKPWAFEAVKHENSCQALIKVTNWHNALFDVSAHVESVFSWTEDGQLLPRISLTGRHVLLNSRPADNFETRLIFQKDSVVLSDLKWGPITAKGDFYLDGRLNFDFSLQGLPLEDVLSLVDDERAVVTEGVINGMCHVGGSLDKMKISGRGYSYNGFVGDWEYSLMDIGVQGFFPRLHFTDAYVAQANGFAFTLSGIVDVSDMRNFKAQSRNWVKEALIAEDDRSREWTVKRTYFGEEGGITELKYLFRKDDSLEEGSGMIGIERKFRF